MIVYNEKNNQGQFIDSNENVICKNDIVFCHENETSIIVFESIEEQKQYLENV